MTSNILLSLSLVIILGITAQWLAWRMRIPSILLLLLFGFIAGPATRILNPDALVGEVLFSEISIAVGFILFEGGLTLKFDELRDVAGVVTRFLTLGALTTWAVGTVAAHFILGFSWPMALLLGAIVIVTGPTVVAPMLRQIRPEGEIDEVLKWEGILIDPVGAVFAVLILEIILAGDAANIQLSAATFILGIIQTLLVGGALGAVTAVFLIFLLRQFYLPDYLQNAFTLMLVIACFALSNLLQEESGLLATTVMGIVLANQSYVPTNSIADFTEDVQTILLGILFIVLSARVTQGELLSIGWAEILFLVVLIVVERPLSVIVAMAFSKFKWREWVFASLMAPRGIVAASVASIFAFELHEAGFEEADRLIPIIFTVIVGSVLFYGLTAGPVARYLGIATADPQGLIIIGANPFARAIGRMAAEQGFKVTLVDTNLKNLQTARMEGLRTFLGNALSESTIKRLDFSGMGRLLAITPNNETNSLAVLHFAEVFDRAHMYQLSHIADGSASDQDSIYFKGRALFDSSLTYPQINRMMQEGAVIKVTRLTEQFGYNEFRIQHGLAAIPLFVVQGEEKLHIITTEDEVNPRPGEKIISLFVRGEEAAENEVIEDVIREDPV